MEFIRFGAWVSVFFAGKSGWDWAKFLMKGSRSFCSVYKYWISRLYPETNVMFYISCCFSHWVMSNSLWPHGLQPSRLLCPWDSPGKKTGAGCHVEPKSSALAGGFFATEPPGKLCASFTPQLKKNKRVWYSSGYTGNKYYYSTTVWRRATLRVRNEEEVTPSRVHCL